MTHPRMHDATPPEDSARPDTAEHGDTDSSAATDDLARAIAERDEAIAARQRALADFRNFQRRADEAETRALTSGAAGAVRSLIPVLDQFELALNQDLDTMSVDQLADGVRMVQQELVKALASIGVDRIEPARGDEFDPVRHEAMMRQAAEDVDSNLVVHVLQPGFALGDLVLRPAKVAVAE